MTSIEAKGARCHVCPPLPRIETSLPDRLVIVQVISYSFTRVSEALPGAHRQLYKAENAARRYDHWLLDSFYFNNHERFFLGSIVGQVDNFALEDVTPVQIHQYFHRVGNIDVKNSEAHPSILQSRIARFRSSDISRTFDMDQPRKLRAIIEASLLRAKLAKFKNLRNSVERMLGRLSRKTGKSSGTDALTRKEIATLGISS
jgi:hypothetical protein